MKKYKRILSLALASAMVMGMFAMSASAEDNDGDGTSGGSVAPVGTLANPATEIDVSKTVKVESKGTLLPTMDFEITMVPATEEQLTVTKEVTDESTGTTSKVTEALKSADGVKIEAGKNLQTDTLTFSFDAKDSTATGSVTKTDSFKFTTKEAFDHAGVYRYYIYEKFDTRKVTQNKTDGEGNIIYQKDADTGVLLTDDSGNPIPETETVEVNNNGYIYYDATKYILDCYVDKVDGNYIIFNYTLTQDGATAKPENVSFTNEVDCQSLKIYKEVDGTEYQSGQFYTFRILIPVGGTTIVLEDKQKMYAHIYDTNGMVIDTENNRTDEEGNVVLTVQGDGITADMGEYGNEFKLKAGEWLQLDGAPVSMIYKVEEVVDEVTDTSINKTIQEQDYTTSITYDEWGTYQSSDNTKLLNKSTKLDTNAVQGTINTLKNEVTVTNKRTITVATGINVDVIPYVLVMLIAVCGAVLFISKKRRIAR
jgi:hypothetical protein